MSFSKGGAASVRRHPGGLRVMSAPAPAPGLRREAAPGDCSLSETLVLKSTFGKIPEVMQWELFFDYLLVHCIAAAALKTTMSEALVKIIEARAVEVGLPGTFQTI